MKNHPVLETFDTLFETEYQEMMGNILICTYSILETIKYTIKLLRSISLLIIHTYAKVPYKIIRILSYKFDYLMNARKHILIVEYCQLRYSLKYLHLAMSTFQKINHSICEITRNRLFLVIPLTSKRNFALQ